IKATGCKPAAYGQGSERRIRIRISFRRQQVGHKQVAALRVGVDGMIQMASAVEVVRQIEVEAIAKVAFDAEIGLLRIGVDEVLGLRITEGLRDQRKERRGIQVVLIKKLRLREIYRLESLLVGQVANVRVARGGQRRRTPGLIHQALENREGIQIGWISCAVAKSRSAECQLAAGGTVGSVSQEIKSEQGMVVKRSVRCAHHRLPVSLGIPRQPYARLDVSLGGLNSLLQTQEVVSSLRQRRYRPERGRNFDVVAGTVIQSQLRARAPGVLPECRNRNVVERVIGIAQALHKVARQAGAVGLNRGKNREWISRNRRNETQLGGGETSEIIVPPVVDGEGGGERQVIDIDAELGVVASDGPGKVVGELIALFDALNEGIRLPAEVGKARNVHCRTSTIGDLRVVEIRKSAAGILEGEFIHFVRA